MMAVLALSVPRTIAVLPKPDEATPKRIEIKPMSIKEIFAHVAKERGFNVLLATEIARCESTYQAVQSFIINKKGIREESYGPVQIHLPDHPEITKEEALDPWFSVNFLIDEVNAGRLWKWNGSRGCWGHVLKKEV